MITDINECERDPTACDENALCNNTDGSYNCTCKDGFLGNGINCTGTKKHLEGRRGMVGHQWMK